MKMSPCYHSKVSPCRLKAEFREQGGAALIIILAFIVLLLVLLLAFFSRATLQEQISKSSSSYTVVDVFAEGATESIIGDLRQEIVAGSLATNYVTGGITNTLYYPLTNTTFEPAVSGFIMTNGLESLLKVSSITNFAPTNSTLYTSLGNNPITNRASIDSTTNVSLNGRSVSTSRWNQPLFITRANPSDTNTTDTTPTNTFPVPTWVLVARDGSNPTNTTVSTNMLWSTTNSSTVIGRYAYAVYDEGYGLDANVAGYPNDGTQTTGTSASNYAYKSGEGFADLTQIGLTTNQIAALVGWRNSASIPVSSGTYPNYSFPANPTNYFQMVMGNTN